MQERLAIPGTGKVALALLVVCLASSCGSEVIDPYCSSSSLPDGTGAKSGQGALLVEGATRAFFYVADSSGKSVNNGTLGRTLALAPGKYQLKVNNTWHPVVVKSATLTKCSTATLLVSGTTREHYYVQDPTGKSIQEAVIGSQLSLMPGSYRVKVNSTFLPAELKLGQTTELKTGTLLVKGLTSDYYYVRDTAGKSLSESSLNKALAFFPGSYRVLVNKTEKAVEIAAAQTAEPQTGSLVAEGAGGRYYYVRDKAGVSLSENAESKPLSFFPGEYTVKLGEETRPAAVDAGQATRVKF